MKRILFFTVLSLVFSGLCAVPLAAQTPRATKFEIKDSLGVNIGGALYITVGGKEQKIADQAVEAWIIDGGREIVYSGADGAGGFENEGQSLRIYTVASRRTQKILSEYFGIVALREVKLSTGVRALLVKMSDGGLGGSYLAVVDPRRGEVLFRHWAELTAIKGDFITLAFYNEDDWDAINQARDWTNIDPNDVLAEPTKVKASKTERHDLKKVLKNKVIFNKPWNMADEVEEPAKPVKFRDVKIYLWKVNDEEEGKNFVLSPVVRRVEAAAPLRPTLEALFAGATEEEARKEFGDSTFGMKFVGVVLRNGTALVKFSQPPNETNYGSLGPMIFADAIERTAKQFPAVKRVEICAIGETLIDAQLTEQFPRCPQ